MIYKLDINDRAALAIKNKTKRIEIRANEGNINKIKIDDIIQFNSNNIGIFYTKVKEINYYESIEKLLTLEGTRYTTSSTDDYLEAVQSINNIDDYDNLIKKNGVYAIHIEYLYSENTVWDELCEKANNVRNKREISGMISAGSVGAAILTKNHNIYTGVCIDTELLLLVCVLKEML